MFVWENKHRADFSVCFTRAELYTEWTVIVSVCSSVWKKSWFSQPNQGMAVRDFIFASLSVSSGLPSPCCHPSPRMPVLPLQAVVTTHTGSAVSDATHWTEALCRRGGQ